MITQFPLKDGPRRLIHPIDGPPVSQLPGSSQPVFPFITLPNSELAAIPTQAGLHSFLDGGQILRGEIFFLHLPFIQQVDEFFQKVCLGAVGDGLHLLKQDFQVGGFQGLFLHVGGLAVIPGDHLAEQIPGQV